MNQVVIVLSFCLLAQSFIFFVMKPISIVSLQTAAAMLSFASLWLFYCFLIRKPAIDIPKKRISLVLLLIFLNGVLLRLVLSYYFVGNDDMKSWQIVWKILLRGGSVYAETDLYNYSPVWMGVIHLCGNLTLRYPALPLHFFLKVFLTLIDCLTLSGLLLIAHIKKIPMIPVVLFFYLNPISILITAVHGQIDGFAIMFLITGILLYEKLGEKRFLSKILLWFFSTAGGLLVKHHLVYQIWICLDKSFKSIKAKILLLAFSAIIFLMLFIPYWDFAQNTNGIINHVFLYPSRPSEYGFASCINGWYHMHSLFILSLFILPLVLKKEDLISQCLLGILFFLVFTTGFGYQYFVLPIALGALRPSKGFFIYSIVGSFFFLGSFKNVGIHLMSFIDFNLVWLTAIYWFIQEARTARIDSRVGSLLNRLQAHI